MLWKQKNKKGEKEMMIFNWTDNDLKQFVIDTVLYYIEKNSYQLPNDLEWAVDDAYQNVVELDAQLTPLQFTRAIYLAGLAVKQ